MERQIDELAELGIAVLCAASSRCPGGLQVFERISDRAGCGKEGGHRIEDDGKAHLLQVGRGEAVASVPSTMDTTLGPLTSLATASTSAIFLMPSTNTRSTPASW